MRFRPPNVWCLLYAKLVTVVHSAVSAYAALSVPKPNCIPADSYAEFTARHISAEAPVLRHAQARHRTLPENCPRFAIQSFAIDHPFTRPSIPRSVSWQLVPCSAWPGQSVRRYQDPPLFPDRSLCPGQVGFSSTLRLSSEQRGAACSALDSKNPFGRRGQAGDTSPALTAW